MGILNSKTLFIALAITGAAAAVIGIGQIWFGFLAWDMFIKAMVTVVIIGVLVGFLSAVDYDLPALSRNKVLLYGMIVLAIIMGLMILGQMWLFNMEWVSFAKIFGTVAILFLLDCFILAIKEDFGTEKKLRDEKFID